MKGNDFDDDDSDGDDNDVGNNDEDGNDDDDDAHLPLLFHLPQLSREGSKLCLVVVPVRIIQNEHDSIFHINIYTYAHGGDDLDHK